MKVRVDQLPQQLNKLNTELPVYLVTGDETLQHDESCDAIRAHLRGLDFTERELYHIDSSFNWDRVMEAANSLSLFAERKIIELRLGSQKIKKAESDLLQRYLENPAPGTVIFILADRLDAGAKKSAWFKLVEKVGLVVEIWPIEVDQLPRWLATRLQSFPISMDNEAIGVLADRVEGNLLAAQQELEKLSLLYPNQTLDANQVAEAVGDMSRFDAFALADAAIQKQPERVQHILQALKQEGVEPTFILWAISRELRTLSSVITDISEGKNYDTIATRLRLFGKRKTVIRNASRQIKVSEIEQLLRLCGQADQAVKGQLTSDPWLIIGQICLRLSGVEMASLHTQHSTH